MIASRARSDRKNLAASERAGGALNVFSRSAAPSTMDLLFLTTAHFPHSSFAFLYYFLLRARVSRFVAYIYRFKWRRCKNVWTKKKGMRLTSLEFSPMRAQVQYTANICAPIRSFAWWDRIILPGAFAWCCQDRFSEALQHFLGASAEAETDECSANVESWFKCPKSSAKRGKFFCWWKLRQMRESDLYFFFFGV